MGYHIQQRGAKFVIKEENFDKALAAIKAMDKTVGHGSWGGSRQFSWVDWDRVLQCRTLAEALYQWRWDVEQEPSLEKNITDIQFNGEKLGDEELLFDAIAPFVEDGSFIEISGEEGAIWQWQFNDDKCIEVVGKVVF